MIDLTGLDNFKFKYVLDEETQVFTISFMSEDELTTYGTIKIESSKLNSFFNSQREVARAFVHPITEGQIRQSTLCRKNQLEGTTRFG